MQMVIDWGNMSLCADNHSGLPNCLLSWRQHPQGYLVSSAVESAGETPNIERPAPVSHLVVAIVPSLVPASAPRGTCC